MKKMRKPQKEVGRCQNLRRSNLGKNKVIDNPSLTSALLRPVSLRSNAHAWASDYRRHVWSVTQ